MPPLPDLQTLGPDDLNSLLEELISREEALSAERQSVHTGIEAVRRELAERLGPDGAAGAAAGGSAPQVAQ